MLRLPQAVGKGTMRGARSGGAAERQLVLDGRVDPHLTRRKRQLLLLCSSSAWPAPAPRATARPMAASTCVATPPSSVACASCIPRGMPRSAVVQGSGWGSAVRSIPRHVRISTAGTCLWGGGQSAAHILGVVLSRCGHVPTCKRSPLTTDFSVYVCVCVCVCARGGVSLESRLPCRSRCRRSFSSPSPTLACTLWMPRVR